MKIKNSVELLKRMREHAAQDRLMHSGYGALTVNGEPEFVGCWMGCAVTPATKSEDDGYDDDDPTVAEVGDESNVVEFFRQVYEMHGVDAPVPA